jgi:hypothetical protein
MNLIQCNKHKSKYKGNNVRRYNYKKQFERATDKIGNAILMTGNYIATMNKYGMVGPKSSEYAATAALDVYHLLSSDHSTQLKIGSDLLANNNAGNLDALSRMIPHVDTSDITSVSRPLLIQMWLRRNGDLPWLTM